MTVRAGRAGSRAGAGAGGTAPTVLDPARIRNVVLVGPSGSGKSRLFDHVVDAVVPGRAPRGQTEPTTGLRAATLSTGKVVLTLLDAPGNAVAEAERPRADGADPDIRFIDLEELEALLRVVPDDVLGTVEGPLYLTAAMTGLGISRMSRCSSVTWSRTLPPASL